MNPFHQQHDHQMSNNLAQNQTFNGSTHQHLSGEQVSTHHILASSVEQQLTSQENSSLMQNVSQNMDSMKKKSTGEEVNTPSKNFTIDKNTRIHHGSQDTVIENNK
jgi:hypothetical protein